MTGTGSIEAAYALRPRERGATSNITTPTSVGSGRLTPTIAYTTPTGPGRIHIQPGLIAHMEPALDAAIAQARAAGGVGIAIEVMDGARVVVRRELTS